MKLPPYTKAVADKLKAVFPADDLTPDVMASVKSNLDDLVADRRATTLSIDKKGYKNRYRVPLTDGDALFVDIYPNDPGRTEWRMVWKYTPSKLNKSDREKLRVLAKEILGTDAQRLLGNVSVTELHVAVDFEVNIADIAIEARDKSACGCWGKTIDARGRLQSQYFGSSASDHQLTAYEKRDEVLAALARKHRTRLSHIKAAADDLSPRMRLEDRQRLSRCPVPLHRLADLREPFAGFHIYSYVDAEAAMELDDETGRLVLALAKAEGLQRVLKLLDKSARDKVRTALAASQVEWWDAAVYAGAVRKVILATGLFPKSAFDLADRLDTEVEARYQQRKQRAEQRGAKPDPLIGLDDEEDGEE